MQFILYSTWDDAMGINHIVTFIRVLHTGIGDNYKILNYFKTLIPGACLVVQWLRLTFSMQGPRFNLWSGELDPMQKLGKKKILHFTTKDPTCCN